jgi:hypothetical protein
MNFWRYYFLFFVDTVLQNLWQLFPHASAETAWDDIYMPGMYARIAILFAFMLTQPKPTACAVLAIFIHALYCFLDLIDQIRFHNTGDFGVEILTYAIFQVLIIFLHYRYEDRPAKEWRRWIHEVTRDKR